MVRLLAMVFPAFLGWASASAPASAGSGDVDSLNRCVRELERAHEGYRRWMPSWLEALRPGLGQMARGIPYRVEIARSLTSPPGDRHLASARPSSRRHLLTNGAQGCRAYLESFREQVAALVTFFAGVGLFGVVLTLRIGLAMVPQNSPRRHHDTDDWGSGSADGSSSSSHRL